METPLTSRHLREIASSLDWTQHEIAARTGIVQSTVARHLTGHRPIRDEHLSAYVRIVPGVDKTRLLTAWIRDVFHEDDLPQLLGADDASLAEEASTWLPPLNTEQSSALQWLAAEMIKDRELDAWMLGMLRSLGYKPSPSD